MDLSSGSFQISSAAAETDILQISSTAAETDFLSLRNQLNLNKDLNGTELKKLLDLLCSCRD